METKFNPVFSFAAASALALVMGMPAGTANATIMLTATSPTPIPTTILTSNLSTLAKINAAFFTEYEDLTLSYKANVGGADDGSFANNYTTVFSNTLKEPSDAFITWDGNGEPFINPCPTCLLIVKDGKQEPAQYLFDLGNWDGKESIQLTGFWPNGGAISNIAIWSGATGGGGDDEIPEPGVLFLMGAGLLGLGMARRRKSA